MKYIIRSKWRMAMVVIDLYIFAACYYLAFLLRFDKWSLGAHYEVFITTLPLAVFLEFIGMYIAGVYRGIWRYASVNDLLNIVKGTIYGSSGLIGAVVFFRGTQGYPRSIFLINALLVILGIGGARFTRRLLLEAYIARRHQPVGKPVIIVGAGDAAEDLIREARQNPRMRCRPVGMVDDDKVKMGQELHGIKVIGTVDDLPELAKEKGAEEILIAIPSATGSQMRRIVDFCRKTGVPYRTVPGVGDILDGKVNVHHLRKVKMEDLLRRPLVKLDRQSIAEFAGGKKILVTGAGGSIGSELCRQIARFSPAEIILLDHSENSLFYMNEEFSRIFPGVKRHMIVADITHSNRVRHIMERIKPEVVFHAAAHKHVPLMENNHRAAFYNNITGTRTVAEAALEYGVKKFVMISTDKAVNPSSVMGVSKRIAEMVIQNMNGRADGKTEFVSVRFGNVLDSMGSVVPLFKRQIEAGGPVTVTHPEVVRYFMTIPEAVQLVLQAAAMGRGGEIFILDMGEPVKVADLAKDMITLSGLEPDEDIQIKYVGLRPGEKLYEELITEGEGILPTDHEKIMVLRPDSANGRKEVMKKISRLEDMVVNCSSQKEIITLARKLVPEYIPSKHN